VRKARERILPCLGPALLVVCLMGCGPAEDAGPEPESVSPDEAGVKVPAEPLDPVAAPETGEAPSDFTLPFPEPPPIPGELVLADGELAFHRCGDPEPVAVGDETGSEAATIVEELGYGSGRVLATVLLYGDRLTQVRYATPEGPGCRDMLPRATLWAAGNEPFWSLRLDGEGARWITPEDMDGVVYEQVRWRRQGEGVWSVWAYPAVEGVEADPDAPAPGEGTPDPGFTMFLEAQRCLDTMSGARFPFTVRVEREGRGYDGCAVEGRLVLDEIP
jgi:uncharacterized membrane protein